MTGEVACELIEISKSMSGGVYIVSDLAEGVFIWIGWAMRLE
jgi:hypothetical protein